MKKVATLMNESEFDEFLDKFKENIDLSSLSYVSKRCQIADKLCEMEPDMCFSVGQLREIFELAK